MRGKGHPIRRIEDDEDDETTNEEARKVITITEEDLSSTEIDSTTGSVPKTTQKDGEDLSELRPLAVPEFETGEILCDTEIQRKSEEFSEVTMRQISFDKCQFEGKINCNQ